MKKLICVLIVALMFFGLAACGKEPEKSEPDNNLLPPGTNDAPESIPEPEPEPEIFLERAMLTGLEKGPDYPEGLRCTGIMMNNIASSRPNSGLSEAKILVEIKVEGGITRFMGIFEDYRDLPDVGGVRSARDQFFQILAPLRGFYVHEGPGANSPVGWMMKDLNYSQYDLDGGARGFRKNRPGMPTEYTLYTNGESITKAIEAANLSDTRDYGNSPIFDFVPYTEPARVPEAGGATEVAVIHSSSYRSLFTYNSTTKKYEMSQWNSSRGGVYPTIDENNNQQISFDNVVVIFAPMSIYDGTQLVRVEYGSGGGGYYISNGGFEPLIWRKGAPNMPLYFENISGSEERVLLNPGTTYLAVVDDSLIEEFDATLRSGQANKAAQGEVNQNEIETED